LLLAPISAAFGALIATRRWLYSSGVLPVARLPVPVVVVGNIMVGGAGKTPLVQALAECLRNHGWHPGIVSRGYGGADPGPSEVTAGGDPRRFGDEPIILARTGVPVFIGRDRGAAARALLRAHGECDVILSDDGLQHYRLGRDVEIVVQDERGVGNGWLLPAGPLREPVGRPRDATVINGPGEDRIESARVFRMNLAPEGLFTVDRAQRRVEWTELAGKRAHAVAGIGNPDRFFRLLADLGVSASTHAFPDHHCFSAADLAFERGDAILMTEKDAVKCAGFAPDGTLELRVKARIDPGLCQFILERISRVDHGRKAS
jgi:tetraacyldisaccharide 4'-kinase